MKFSTTALVGGFAAAASAAALEKREWKMASVWCNADQVTKTVYVTAGETGGSPAPTQKPNWTSDGYVTSVQYSTSVSQASYNSAF